MFQSPFGIFSKYLCFPFILLLFLNACARVPPDLGRGEVEALLAERGLRLPEQVQQDPNQRDVAGAISLADAIKLALSNNPQIKIYLASLGLGAADLVAASQIHNPVLSLTRLGVQNQSGSHAGERVANDFVGLSLVASLTDALTWRARKRLAEADFAVFKQQVSGAVLTTITEVQQVYIRYVAAQLQAELADQRWRAANISERVAQRYFDAGNITESAMVQAAAGAAEAHIAKFEAAAERKRQHFLMALSLGLSAGTSAGVEMSESYNGSGIGDALTRDSESEFKAAGTGAKPWSVPAVLAVLPEQEMAVHHYVNLAQTGRLDLMAAQAELKAAADRSGFAEATALITELNLGFVKEREVDGGRMVGGELEWELPLFTQRQGSRLRQRTQMLLAAVRYAGLVNAVNNEVRANHFQLLTSRARVLAYQDALIPARRAATQQALLSQNYMLLGVFDLIDVKQQEYASYQVYFDALRDYWLARIEMERSVGRLLHPEQLRTGDALSVADILQAGLSETAVESDQHHLHHHSRRPAQQRRNKTQLNNPTNTGSDAVRDQTQAAQTSATGAVINTTEAPSGEHMHHHQNKGGR